MLILRCCLDMDAREETTQLGIRREGGVCSCPDTQPSTCTHTCIGRDVTSLVLG